MTATVPWAALTVLTAAALLILFGNHATRWIRRRNWIRIARRHWTAHPSIDQASHDRGPVPGKKEET